MEVTASVDAADKLYVVTRADLSSGTAAVQVAHAVSDFVFSEPEFAGRWHELSRYLIVLSVPSENALYEFAGNLPDSVAFGVWREPDLGYEATAVWLAPSVETRKACSQLPLYRSEPHTEHRLRDRERRLTALCAEMVATPQTEGLSVLNHGVMVRNRSVELISMLGDPEALGSSAGRWRLPSWVWEYGSELAELLVSPWELDRYTIMHDCGKPAVRVVDDSGRHHFPGHSEASSRTIAGIYPDAEVISQLVADDLVIHLVKADGLAEFMENSEWATHLLVGLAEVHANAEMFGGVKSDGFKAKWRQLDRRGRALCRLALGEPSVPPRLSFEEVS